MKTKSFLSLIAAAVLVVGCDSEEQFGVGLTGKSELKATVEGNQPSTRVGFTNTGAFYWSTGDQMLVDNGETESMFELSTGAGEASATFSGSGTVAGYAIYPFNANHDVDGENLVYNFPATYNNYTPNTVPFVEDKTTGQSFNPAMFGEIKSGSVSLGHLGGVFVVQVNSMKVAEGTFTFTVSEKISGTYTTALSTAATDGIKATPAENDAEKTVTFNFTGATVGGNAVFYIPVPVGTYDDVCLKIADDTKTHLYIQSSKAYDIKRRTMYGIKIQDSDLVAGEQEAVEQNLRAALADSETAEFTLTSDIEISTPLVVAKNFTLDLNGYTIAKADGEMTQVLNTKDAVVLVRRGATLTVKDGTTDKKGTIDGGGLNTTIKLTDSNDSGLTGVAKLVVESGNITNTTAFAISGNGSRDYSIVEIKGGKITSDSDYAIYLPAATTDSNVNLISGGEISGGAGAVAICDGVLTIENGTFTSKGSGNTGSYSDGTGGYQFYTIGVGVGNAKLYGNTTVNINGGTFTAEGAAEAIGIIDESETSYTATVSVSEGNFSDPSALDYLATGAEVNVTLTKNYIGSGFGLFEKGNGANATVVVDLGGNEWTLQNPLYGSTGTVTQSFHFERGANVTLKNGTITLPTDADSKMFIQNYCTLNLIGLTLNGQNLNQNGSDGSTGNKRYVVSNNNGTTTITNTTINAGTNHAFDVYHNPSNYPDGVKVVLESGTINGDIEVVSKGTDAAKCVLEIKDGTINMADRLYTEIQQNIGAVRIDGLAKVLMSGGTINTKCANPDKDGQTGVVLRGNGIFEMSGGKIDAGWYAVAGNGTDNADSNNGVINISGTAELTSAVDYAIFLPHKGTTTISGGTITGKTGAIATRYEYGHVLNISGGSLTGSGLGSTGTWADGTGGMSNAALMLLGNPTVTISGTASINGGSGGNTAAISAREKTTLNINGGTFTVGGDADELGNSCIYAKDNAQVTIAGGTFCSEKMYANRYWVLNKYNASGSTATISVKGGTFKNFNPNKPSTDDTEPYTAENATVSATGTGTIDTNQAWSSTMGDVDYTVTTN